MTLSVTGVAFLMLCVLTITAVGYALGSIKIGTFTLTITGGCLLVSLAFGHFGHIGKVSIVPSVKTLKVLRELGLMLFLIGAGIAGRRGRRPLHAPTRFPTQTPRSRVFCIKSGKIP